MASISDDNNSNASSFDEQEQQVESSNAAAPLLDVLSLMRQQKFQTTIPDAVTERLLRISGCTTTDPKVVKLISVAAQKFMAVLANDTLQHYKMRGAPQQSSRFKGKDGKDETRNVLLMEDLTASVVEHGLVVRKPPYFV